MLQRFLKTRMILVLLPLIVSCSSNESTGTSSEDINNIQESGGIPDADTKPAIAANIDPVCEMEKENTWTDYSVANNDTVWFCSEGCKQAFDARPEKYIGKK